MTTSSSEWRGYPPIDRLQRELAEARTEIERLRSELTRHGVRWTDECPTSSAEREAMTTSSDDLLSRLRALARHEHDDASVGDEAADEIESLRKKAGQRGARMQVMLRFLRRSPDVSAAFRQHMDAADWFDADGVPK